MVLAESPSDSAFFLSMSSCSCGVSALNEESAYPILGSCISFMLSSFAASESFVMSVPAA